MCAHSDRVLGMCEEGGVERNKVGRRGLRCHTTQLDEHSVMVLKTVLSSRLGLKRRRITDYTGR